MSSKFNVKYGLSVGVNPVTEVIDANGLATFTGIELANVADLSILGGSNGQVLTTDGTGTLSWSNISATSLVNGNSNVVVAANSNVSIGIAGSANIVVVSSAGANVTGNLGITGNVTANNVLGTIIKSTQSVGSEGGEISLAAPAANTSINTGVNLDVYQNKYRIFEAGGNIRGYYLDMTKGGDVASTNLMPRAWGLVATDTTVTLDDLSASVTNNNQLKLQLTSGSWQGTGWTQTFTNGSTQLSNWVNLPLSTGYDFASGQMNSQGNGCKCVISDQTPSAKVYEITVVRSGTSGNQWNISIERLVQ